jgi:hypothetical protein
VSGRARLAWWLVGSAAACMALFWLYAVAFPAAFDYAESDTATWIWLARHGQPLYGALHGASLPYSNYPPLQLHLIAALADSDAAILPVGRLVAFAGLMLACAMVAWAVWMPTGSRRAALGAAVLVAVTLPVGYYGMTCRADGLALGLGALALMVGVARVRGWPIWSALLFSVAVLCKHTLICFPIGFTLWALRRAPRQALVMAGTMAAVVGTCIWKLGLLGPLLVWSRAPWDLGSFGINLGISVVPSLVGLVIAARVLFAWDTLSPRAQRMLEPWVAIYLVGLAWLFALGRKGASSNYLLELLVATTVIVVVAVDEGRFRRLFHVHLILTWLETAVWVGILLFSVMPESRLQQRTATAALAGVRGPVFAEQTWQATATGHPPLVIPFLSTQLALAGHWDPAPFVDVIARGEVERLLLNFPLTESVERDPLHRDRFLPDELAAMRARYRLIARGGDLFVYAPK